MGGHSTSDDATIYRSAEEVELWKRRDPIVRFTAYLMKKGIISDQENKKIIEEIDAEMSAVVKEREKVPPPAASTLFTDVYAEMPWHLREEAEEFMREEGENGPQGEAYEKEPGSF